MKYIVFVEYKPEDFDKVIEKRKQLMEGRERTPEKYTKILFSSHIMSSGGPGKSFTVVEGTEEQIMNAALLYGSVAKFEYVPIFESDKVIELSENEEIA